MSNPTESIYEPLWTRLKRDKVLSVRVHPTNFRRIVDGIRKRKDKDLRFKRMNAVDPCRLLILRKETEGIVSFFLKQSVGISNIIVPEAIDAVVDNLSDEDI
jgi:hypothetical protein